MAGRVRRRRRWPQEEKRRIVAQTLIPEVSVSQVARRYGINTHLVFKWRHDPRLRLEMGQVLGPTLMPFDVTFDIDSPIGVTSAPSPEG